MPGLAETPEVEGAKLVLSKTTPAVRAAEKFPARRRREVLARFPAFSEHVVSLSLVRVFENFVRLPYPLELLLGVPVFVDVGVILSRELPVCLLNLFLSRAPGNPEHFVIILVFNWHFLPSRLENRDLRGPEHASSLPLADRVSREEHFGDETVLRGFDVSRAFQALQPQGGRAGRP